MIQSATRTAAIWECTYPGHTHQIHRIRAELRELLTGCPAADEAILCASELAANAAVHSSSALPGGHLTIRVQQTPGQAVRIEVTDQGGRWNWTGSTRYHGLHIVHCLAAGWGITGDYRTRTTWALLSWHSDSTCPPPLNTAASPAATILHAALTRGHGQRTAILDGPRIRDLRQLHHLTRQQFASRAGLSPATIARLERQDYARASLRTMTRVANALGEHPAAITRTLTSPTS